jgi:PAS domain S-box-containing protein
MENPTRRLFVARLQKTALATGLVPLVLGLCAVAGWLVGSDALKGVAFGGITVKANTAVCMALAGAALLLLRPERRRRWRTHLGRGLAMVVAAVGLITLSEHLVGWEAGIDQLLFTEAPGAAATRAPNRMGPPASLCFPLLAAALLLLDRPGRGARVARQLCALLPMTLALGSVLGYLFEARALFGVARYTGIALHTALAFLALGTGILVARSEGGLVGRLIAPDAGGLLVRRLLPAAVVLPIVLAKLRVAGQNAGLYDLEFGRTLLVLSFIVLFSALVFWTGVVVSGQARSRERAEDARRQAGEQFRALTNTVPGIVWTAPPEGTAVYVSQQWYAFTGSSRDTPVPEAFLAAIHPEDRAAWEASWVEARRGGQEFRCEFRLRGASGEYRWFLGRATPLRDPWGAVSQWFGINTDITDRRRSEDALREADRRKDEFLATLAHELRNPLAPMATGLELMRVDPAAVQPAQAIMQRQLGHMVRLVDDLLDVSRITLGRIELRRARLRLSEVVETALQVSRPLVERQGHALLVTLPAEEVWIDGDEVRLAQILQNLLNNAAKYTPPGGQVALQAERADGGRVVLRVRDTGRGFAPELAPRLFEMFYRAGQRYPGEGGLGIGLALARRLAELHGGSLSAHSAGEDRGSEFVVDLPTAAAPADGGVAVPPPSPARPLRRRRILLADDNADALESLELLLSSAGHEVRTARDGVEACTVAEDFRPEVALLDIGMPQRDGHAVARHIRGLEWGRGALLVAVSGWSQDEDRRRSREAGFDLHLAKPVTPEALQDVLTR